MAKIIRISVLSLLASVSIGCGGGSPGAPVDEGSSSVTLNPVEPMTPGCENSVTLAADDPAFETDQCKLAEPLMCTPFENPDKEPVLLIHGTFTNGPEQYTSTYIPYLRDLGFDVCITTYPDRGFGDQQISAEYVVYAVLRIHQETGLKVDMAGHSQGASMPRWAIRWWPSVQNALDDFVMHAGPNHGTIIADQNGSNSQPPAFWQFQTGSNFVAAVNTVDETPGDIDYTSIYTTYDELVQPQPTLLTPNGESTSALDVDLNNPNRVNIWLQGICPSNSTDHVSIGLTDGTTAQLTVDAFMNDGPADVVRAGGMALCAAQPAGSPLDIPATIQGAAAGGFSTVPADAPMTDAEPPLKAYAQPQS